MAYNSISGYSTTRITGLASGMDTDTLVQNLMKTEQSKIDRLYKQNAKLEWKKDAYTGINSQIKDFREKFMSVLSDDNVFGTSIYRQYKINMEASKYLTIKGTSTASVGSHSITGFKMAEAATAQGAKHRNRTVSTTGTAGTNMSAVSKGAVALESGWKGKTLDQLKNTDGNNFFDFTGTNTTELKFKVNGKEFSFDASTATLDDVLNAVNNQSAGAKMSVSSDGFISLESTSKGANVTLKLENMENSPRVFADNGVFGTSFGIVKATNAVSTDMTFAQIEAAAGRVYADDDGKISFKINGETFSFDKHTKLEDALDEINNNSKANVTISYDTANDKFTIKSNAEGSGAKLQFENIGSTRAFGSNGLFKIDAGSITNYQSVDRQTDTIAEAAEKMGVKLQLDDKGMFSFSIKAKNSDGEEVIKDFSFDPSKITLQKMIDQVNGDPDLNVKLNYSQITDSFTFTSGETGADASFELISKNGVNAFGGADSFFGIGAGTYAGTNAVVMIDGERVEQSSNNFVLDGISFNLKTNFNSSVNENGEVVFGDAEAIDFSVTQDVDTVVDKVKAFVEEYNQLVSYLNGLISEEVDYDYEPLSEDERKSLSEDEIEKWDAQAKKGIMRNDNMISSLLSQMRMALFETVGDTGLSPSDIGLTTGSWNNKGQIQFDETKFRSALAENPDKVAQVMAGVSESKDENTKYKESGILSRFYTQMTSYEKTVKDNNLANTTKQISNNESKMQEMLERMYELEEKYYLQFAQMETLMSKYQSQSDWLSQQLGSM